MGKFFVFLWVCWAGISITTAQEQVKITRFQGDKITGMDVSGAFEITVRQGEKTGATLSIPALYEKNLIFVNEGGILKIGFKGRIKEHNKKDKFIAEIVCSSLETIELSGACQLRGEGNFTAQQLTLDLSGASQVFVGKIEVNTKGNIEMSGASSCGLGLYLSEVKLDISGASKLTLSGSAEKGDMEISGAAKANLDNFVSKKFVLDASGASYVNLKATESLQVEASGASRVKYSGDPQVVIEKSGASSVRKE